MKVKTLGDNLAAAVDREIPILSDAELRTHPLAGLDWNLRSVLKMASVLADVRLLR